MLIVPGYIHFSFPKAHLAVKGQEMPENHEKVWLSAFSQYHCISSIDKELNQSLAPDACIFAGTKKPELALVPCQQ